MEVKCALCGWKVKSEEVWVRARNCGPAPLLFHWACFVALATEHGDTDAERGGHKKERPAETLIQFKCKQTLPAAD